MVLIVSIGAGLAGHCGSPKRYFATLVSLLHTLGLKTGFQPRLCYAASRRPCPVGSGQPGEPRPLDVAEPSKRNFAPLTSVWLISFVGIDVN